MADVRLNRPLILFLCLAPLQWVKVISIGGGTIEAAHLALTIPPIMLWVKKKAVLPHSSLRGILLMHPFLFGALLLALPFSDNLETGIKIIIRMSAYYVFGLLLLLWLCSIKVEEFRYTLSKSIFYVCTVFTTVFGYYVVASGTNILLVLSSAVQSANPNFIQYYLFVNVMNKGQLDGLTAEDSIAAAGRHGIMIFLIIVFFSRIILPKIGESRLQLVLGRFFAGAILGFIFLSLSRVAILILICASLMYFLYRLALSKVSPATYLVLVAALLFGIVYLYFGEQGQISDILYEKLIIDVVNNPRVFEFFQILDRIDHNSFFGAGTGTELDLFGLAAKAPHNLILFWWYQAGFIGLFFSAVALIVFIFFCWRLWSLSVNSPVRTDGYVYLLSAILLVAPIIRMLVAKQGALAQSEWISIAVAVALANSALKPVKGLPKIPSRDERQAIT